MIGPQVVLLFYTWRASSAAFFVFALLGVAAGLIMLTVPETLGKPLPDTWDEADRLARIKSPALL